MGATIKKYFPFEPVLLHIDGEEIAFVNDAVAKHFADLYCKASKENLESALEDLDIYWSAEDAMNSFFEEEEEWKESDGIPDWWKEMADVYREDAEAEQEKIRVTDE